jgi:hypothetical protein
MKTLTLLTCAIALCASAAYAQTAAPVEVPPSSCPAIVQAPPPPDGATATEAQMRDAAAGWETWRVQAEATMQCRRTEVNALNAQARARRAEYDAAEADNAARLAAFEAQIAAARARRNR